MIHESTSTQAERPLPSVLFVLVMEVCTNVLPKVLEEDGRYLPGWRLTPVVSQKWQQKHEKWLSHHRCRHHHHHCYRYHYYYYYCMIVRCVVLCSVSADHSFTGQCPGAHWFSCSVWLPGDRKPTTNGQVAAGQHPHLLDDQSQTPGHIWRIAHHPGCQSEWCWHLWVHCWKLCWIQSGRGNPWSCWWAVRNY